MTATSHRVPLASPQGNARAEPPPRRRVHGDGRRGDGKGCGTHGTYEHGGQGHRVSPGIGNLDPATSGRRQWNGTSVRACAMEQQAATADPRHVTEVRLARLRAGSLRSPAMRRPSATSAALRSPNSHTGWADRSDAVTSTAARSPSSTTLLNRIQWCSAQCPETPIWNACPTANCHAVFSLRQSSYRLIRNVCPLSIAMGVNCSPMPSPRNSSSASLAPISSGVCPASSTTRMPPGTTCGAILWSPA